MVKIHDNIIKSKTLILLVSNEDLSKDSKYFSSINDYIDDCLSNKFVYIVLSTINFSTITALKKIITNLNVLL